MNPYDLLALLAAGGIATALWLTRSIPRPELEHPPLPHEANELEVLLHEIQCSLPDLRGKVSRARVWHHALWMGEVMIGTLLTLGIINEHEFVPPLWAAIGAAMVAVAGVLRKQYKPEERLQVARYQANERAKLFDELKHGYGSWCAGERDPGEVRRLAADGRQRLDQIMSKDSDSMYDARDRTRVSDLVLHRISEERVRRAETRITTVYMPIVGTEVGGDPTSPAHGAPDTDPPR